MSEATEAAPAAPQSKNEEIAPPGGLSGIKETVQAYQGRAERVLKGVAEEATAVHQGVVESVKTVYGQVSETVQNASLNPLNSCIRRTKTPEAIAMEKAKEEAELLKEEGNNLFKEGRLADALFHYEKAIALCPNDAKYRCNRAACLVSMGRIPQAAVELMKAAVCAEPGYSRPRERMGEMTAREGGLLALVEACQFALKKDRENDELRGILEQLSVMSHAKSQGELQFKRGNYAEGEEIYGKALEQMTMLNGRNKSPPIGAIVLLFNRAACRAAVTRYREALADLDAALEYDPKFEQANKRRDVVVLALNRAEAFGVADISYGVSLSQFKEQANVTNKKKETLLLEAVMPQEDAGQTPNGLL